MENNTKQQSSIEWYEQEINLLLAKYLCYEISEKDFIIMKRDIFYPAKEMHKVEIVNAVDGFPLPFRGLEGEDYYNEIYGGNNER